MKIKYRPEIDGLRAIAVGIVVLYHADIKLRGYSIFTGGFIGVDIFFVISGYLITSIILNELISTGYFSFKNFYERRVRRILPALIVVMFVTLPFAWIYLLPSNLIEFCYSILYSLGFSSNFYFWNTGQIYGVENGILKPFLHTWSLSVEEQFYIIFPITLVIIYKFFNKYLFHFLVIGFLISLITADWSSRNYESVSFYFIHTRIWELLSGSILAYLEINYRQTHKNNFLYSILPTLGMLLIIYSTFNFNEKTIHPSFYTLLPVIGTCLIIRFSGKKDLLTKILTTKLFVGIGLISYSLYLWHYPVFAFNELNWISQQASSLNFIEDKLSKKIFLCLLSIFFSIITYFFVERKFRNLKKKFKKILIIILLGICLLIFIILTVFLKNGFPDRFIKYTEINKNYNPDNVYLSRENKLQKKYLNINRKNLIIEKPNILVFGDSTGEDLFKALISNENLKDKFNFLLINERVSLRELFKKYEDVIIKVDAVILSNRWGNDGLKELNRNIEMLKKTNKNIVITSRTNEYRTINHVGTILDHKVRFSKNKFNYYDLKKLYYKYRIFNSDSKINKNLENFANLHDLIYLNKEDYMCEIEKKECFYVSDEGHKLMYDAFHYTKAGSKYFGKKIYEINWLKIN